eukprot:scaffold10108_cov37-Phaeocystis_antarctica.AAC.1
MDPLVREHFRHPAEVEAAAHPDVLSVGRFWVRLIISEDVSRELPAVSVVVQAVCKCSHVRVALEQVELLEPKSLKFALRGRTQAGLNVCYFVVLFASGGVVCRDDALCWITKHGHHIRGGVQNPTPHRVHVHSSKRLATCEPHEVRVVFKCAFDRGATTLPDVNEEQSGRRTVQK